MESFTPIPSLIGGLIIGLSSCILLLGIGARAGISGIVSSMFGSSREWRPYFMIGMIVTGGLIAFVFPQNFANTLNVPWWLLALGGFAMGFGTRTGSGCTSGHGVCGIPLLSARSIVATITFILSGMVTVYIIHALGVAS